MQRNLWVIEKGWFISIWQVPFIITMQGKNSTETGLAAQRLDLYVNMPETGEVESVR